MSLINIIKAPKITRGLGLLVVAGIGMGTLAFLQEGSDATLRSSPPIQIAVSHTPLSAPFYIAEHLNLFEDSELKVTLIDTPGGKKCYSLLKQGKVDYATSSESVLVFAALHGDDYRLLSSFVESGNDIKVVARGSSSQGAQLLASQRKIGMVNNSASEYFAKLVLKLWNVDSDSVEMVGMRPTEMKSALVTGEIDVAVIWEPYAYQILNEHGDQFRLLDTKSIYTLSFNLLRLPARSDTQPVVDTEILRILKKSIDYMYTHPEESKQVIRDHLKLDEDFVDWVWSDYDYHLSLNRSLLMTMRNQAVWAIESGRYPGAAVPEFEQYAFTLPLTEVGHSFVRH